MPTYEYRREDGSTFEIEQRITEDALTTCPTTGQPVQRVISGGTGLIFKGSGFYLTDYARAGGAGSAASSAAASSDDTGSEGGKAAAKDGAAQAGPAKRKRADAPAAGGKGTGGSTGADD